MIAGSAARATRRIAAGLNASVTVAGDALTQVGTALRIVIAVGGDIGYAVSKVGVQPSTYITWFQADVACRASGKRLPSNAEWTFAATGTVDFGASGGEGGSCRTTGTVRPTGQGPGCVSLWGAQDMIGNASEWISEWQASPPASTSGLPSILGVWGQGFNDDWTTNLTSVAGLSTGWQLGVPAGVLRGGSVDEGVGAGVFSVNLSVAPSNAYANASFRCVIPR